MEVLRRADLRKNSLAWRSLGSDKSSQLSHLLEHDLGLIHSLTSPGLHFLIKEMGIKIVPTS